MRKEKMQEFAVRVTQANRSELIVIMYDMILEDLLYAKECVAEDTACFDRECRHAQRIINELMASLDYCYSISFDLLSLYSYVNKQLVAALMKRDVSYFDSVEDVIQKLKVGFVEVSNQDHSGSMMENTQQVYAGLTYGRGTLNESSYADVNRGFVV